MDTEALLTLARLHLRETEVRVLAYIIAQFHPEDRTVALSYGQIAKALDMSRPHVRQVIVALIAKSVLATVGGCWCLRPLEAWHDLPRSSGLRPRDCSAPTHVDDRWRRSQPLYQLKLRLYGPGGYGPA